MKYTLYYIMLPDNFYRFCMHTLRLVLLYFSKGICITFAKYALKRNILKY